MRHKADFLAAGGKTGKLHNEAPCFLLLCPVSSGRGVGWTRFSGWRGGRTAGAVFGDARRSFAAAVRPAARENDPPAISGGRTQKTVRTAAENAGHRARKRARRFGVRGPWQRFALFGGVSLARAGKVWYSKTNDDRARMKPARAALQARRRQGGQPPRRKEGIRMAHKHREETEIVWSDRKHILWFPWTFEVYRIGDGRIYTRKGLVIS